MPDNKEITSKGLTSLGAHARLMPDKDKRFFASEQARYRFNIIGTGTMGLEHLRVTMFEGRGTVHGVFDKESLSVENAKRTFAEAGGEEPLVVYDSLEDACNDPAADGLMICTPNYTHLDVVRQAAGSGKHILLEKPIATTIEDAREIVRIAQSSPAVFRVGLQYRYKAIHSEAIQEALVRRSIGEIKTISIVEQRIPFLDKIDQWNKYSRFSGGTLVEKCCHYFDLINHFAQSRPQTVYATGSMAVNFLDFQHDHGKSDVLDNAMVTIVYDNGVRASFQLAMFAPMIYEEVVLCGDEGRLKAWENEDFLPGSSLKSHMEIHGGNHRPSRHTTPSYPCSIQESGHNDATYFEHVSLMNTIEGKADDGPTPADAFWSVVVGSAAEASVKSGEVVDVARLLADKGISPP